jgi:hypothetical protein
MTALHMGSLHAIEIVLVVVLAVGPFLALAAAIVIARRRDRADQRSSVEPVETIHPHPQENSWC